MIAKFCYNHAMVYAYAVNVLFNSANMIERGHPFDEGKHSTDC